MATNMGLRRQENLRRLIEDRGGPTSLSKVLGYSNASYLSQMTGPQPSRGVSEKAARGIEQKLGLPEGFLDREQSSSRSVIQAPAEPVERMVESEELDTERLSASLTTVFEALTDMGATLPPAKLADVVTFAYHSGYDGQDMKNFAHRILKLAI